MQEMQNRESWFRRAQCVSYTHHSVSHHAVECEQRLSLRFQSNFWSLIAHEVCARATGSRKILPWIIQCTTTAVAVWFMTLFSLFLLFVRTGIRKWRRRLATITQRYDVMHHVTDVTLTTYIRDCWCPCNLRLRAEPSDSRSARKLMSMESRTNLGKDVSIVTMRKLERKKGRNEGRKDSNDGYFA